MSIDSFVLSQRARAEAARIASEINKDLAQSARIEIEGALTTLLTEGDVDVVSYTVGEPPEPTGLDDGTIGAYFTSAGLLQKVKLVSGEWEPIGRAIATEDFVNDKASLLASEIQVISDAQGAGVIGYATKALMDTDTGQDAQTLALVTNDETASNNGFYRFDGEGWIATDFTTNITNINAAFTEEGEPFEV